VCTNDRSIGYPTSYDELSVYPLMERPDEFDRELEWFMHIISRGAMLTGDELKRIEMFYNPFFPRIAVPMYQAHVLARAGQHDTALDTLGSAMLELSGQKMNDWLAAGTRWIARRMQRAAQKAGVSA